LEHVEFVIDQDFESFMRRYPDLQFDLKAITKESNPDISLKLGEYSVKFHNLPLDKVIEEELRAAQQ
jgi:predicted metalloenzyme YecM